MSIQFEPVMSRLKDAVGAASFADLGRMLGLTTSAYANRKKTGSIPYEAIVDLASSEKISLDWLIFGELREMQNPLSANAQGQIDAQLLGRIVGELQRAYRPAADTEEAVRLAQLAGASGYIYNKVAFEDDEDLRAKVLVREVRDMAQVLNLVDNVGRDVAFGSIKSVRRKSK